MKLCRNDRDRSFLAPYCRAGGFVEPASWGIFVCLFANVISHWAKKKVAESKKGKKNGREQKKGHGGVRDA